MTDLVPTPIENPEEYLTACVPVTDEALEELATKEPKVEDAHGKLVYAIARHLRMWRQGAITNPPAADEPAQAAK